MIKKINSEVKEFNLNPEEQIKFEHDKEYAELMISGHVVAREYLEFKENHYVLTCKWGGGTSPNGYKTSVVVDYIKNFSTHEDVIDYFVECFVRFKDMQEKRSNI